MFLSRMPRHIIAVAIKLQPMLASQPLDKFLIRLRLTPAQPMIEMNHRKHNPQLPPQLQQHPQKSDRINPPGNGHAQAIPRPQHFLPPNVRKHALRQGMHGNMVQRSTVREQRGY